MSVCVDVETIEGGGGGGVMAKHLSVRLNPTFSQSREKHLLYNQYTLLHHHALLVLKVDPF